MNERTKLLKDIVRSTNNLSASVSKVNENPTEKSALEKYFEAYVSHVATLPQQLRAKCQREIQKAVSDILFKYSELAEELED